MTEYDALLAAICADPDEDALRLAFADWLEEHDEPERAAFVRAQLELARTPPWEPFAVACKWPRFAWQTGEPFRHTLPTLDDGGLEWPRVPFRRGLPWGLHVRSLHSWEAHGPRLLACAPLQSMMLWPAATFDDWIRFAQSPVVSRLREVHFAASPIEPLRALREHPAARGIRDVHFQRATGAGMPEVLEDLFASPLGPCLRGLHFRMGLEALDHVIAAIDRAGTIERLSFDTLGLTGDHMRQLAGTHALRDLVELHVRNEYLDEEGLRELLDHLPSGLCDLTCSNVHMRRQGTNTLAGVERLANLRRLNLGENELSVRMVHALTESASLAGLRSLALVGCGLIDEDVRSSLIRAHFWTNLVELDLFGNKIVDSGVRALLDAPMPPDLTALVLGGYPIRSDLVEELRNKFGERLVLPELRMISRV